MSKTTRPTTAAAATPAPTAAELLLTQTAAAGTQVAQHVRYQVSTLSPTVVEKLANWDPQLTRRRISIAEWRTYECAVRTAAVLAAPSSETVARDMLGTALGCVQWAVTERSMAPDISFVFRETTTAAYLATLVEGTRHVYSSHLRQLVAGVTKAQDTTKPVPTAEDADTEAVDDTTVEPLLMTSSSFDGNVLTRLHLTDAAAREYLDALALVRAQVLVVEPNAMRREERFAGAGRAVPYGDIEVIALLAAAASLRVTKSRQNVTALLCLGLGAGITGQAAAHVIGGDVVKYVPAFGGPGVYTHTSDGARLEENLVPLHTAFADPVLRAAKAVGPKGSLLGGTNDRRNRVNLLGTTLWKSSPHLVRVNSARLAATWTCVQLTNGANLADLLAIRSMTSAFSLDAILTYLPRKTTRSLAVLSGVTPTELAPVSTALVDEQDAS